jgi:NADH-quinone oxidoreductase subunit J
MLVLLFILFAGLAIGCAVAVVAQNNPLYSAISLIGVFVALACLYVMLAAPFIAAVQVIVYAGAIMVLVVFVIMLLNVEQEERRRTKLGFLVPAALVLAGILVAEATFIIYFVEASPTKPTTSVSDTGLTSSIGSSLFTYYLLPFEITSILLLMAMVGAMTLTRRIREAPAGAAIVPGSQVLALNVIDSSVPLDDTRAVVSRTTDDVRETLGVNDEDLSNRD